jgi:putative ABC transport system permease protein
MFRYYIRLAYLSFRRHIGLTALMVTALGIGIAACVVTQTVYQAMSGNPLWWKNDRLYSVTMDNWSKEFPANEDRPHLPPSQLNYRDATFLYESNIPVRKVIMYKGWGVLTVPDTPIKPVRATTRITTADFFAMFDTPFQFGAGWADAADLGPEPLIVLSKELNDLLFRGQNSVGRRVRWSDHEFRVIGVLREWNPLPKFYDLNNGNFELAEGAYIPWGWGIALEHYSAGSTNTWKPEVMDTFSEFLQTEAVWIQMWVELPSADHRRRMQSYIDAYWADQRRAGRFERPRNNRLTNIGQWLKDLEVVQDDNRVLVGLAFAFLMVCLLNTAGLLLAKLLNGASIAGVRRALGASRSDIFLQHLTEAGLIAAGGGIVGMILGALGLWGVRSLYNSPLQQGGAASGYQALAHFDASSALTALWLSAVAALLAGLYPAWRIGRVAPANYLKSQR